MSLDAHLIRLGGVQDLGNTGQVGFLLYHTIGVIIEYSIRRVKIIVIRVMRKRGLDCALPGCALYYRQGHDNMQS